MFDRFLDLRRSYVTFFRTLLSILTIASIATLGKDASMLSFICSFLIFLSIFLKNDDNWGVLAIVFLSAFNILDLATNYLVVSNHNFLIIYTSVVFVFSLYYKKDERKYFLENQLVIIFGLVMVLSGIQKILSPDFVTGDFVGYLFYSGGLTKLWSFIEPIKEFTRENQELVTKISEIDPLQNGQYFFTNHSEKHIFWLKLISWIIILSELVIGLMAFIIPQRGVFYISSFLLMFGIMITRLETGFIALLCSLILLIIPPQFRKIIFAFIFLYCTSLALILIDFGVS